MTSGFLHMEEEFLKCWNLKYDTVQVFELEGAFQQLDSQLLLSLEREKWGFVNFLLSIKQIYMKCLVKSDISWITGATENYLYTWGEICNHLSHNSEKMCSQEIMTVAALFWWFCFLQFQFAKVNHGPNLLNEEFQRQIIHTF